MSVPYETACEPVGSPETPQELLARLLGRALNSFELPDELLHRLGSALAHDSALHSAHHSAGLHRITYRHTWLLADGSARTLWELAHNTGLLTGVLRPSEPGRETTAASSQQARQDPHMMRDPLGVQDRHGMRDPREAQVPHRTQESREQPHEWRDRHWRDDQYELYAEEEQLRAAMMRLPLPLDEPIAFDLPFATQLPSVPLPRHVYVPDNSADHARRLLRRAENADRPGGETVRLLGSAAAHQITQAFGRPTLSVDTRLGFSLYEHAFLLTDGREISLWEVEHTATPDGRHMCEVYTSEVAARKAMVLRASRAN